MQPDPFAAIDLGPGGEPEAAPSLASAESGRGPGASHAILWSMGGQLATTFASLVSTVVLARILTPTDFGAFAFAATIYAVVQWLLQAGMGNYLLREAEVTQLKIDGATAMSGLQGVAGLLIVLLAAPLAGWFGKFAAIGWVTASVAVVPLLGAPEAISDALWMRDGRFARVAVLQVAKAALQSLVSVAAQLWFGWGVYALVAGLIAASLTSFAAAAWSLRRDYRAWPRIDARVGAALRGFGGRTFVLTLAQILSLRVPDLLISRLVGVGALGHYSRAANASDMFVRTASAAVTRATAPRFYAEVNAGRPLPEAVTSYCDVLLFFLWPGLAGLAVLSGPVIHLIYGPQWGLAAVALPLLCLVAAIDAARTGGMEVLLIRDRLGLNARIEFVHGAYAIALMVVLARFGLLAALWGKVAESVLTFVLYAATMRRMGALNPLAWPALLTRNLLLATAAGAPAFLPMARWHWPGQLDFTGFATAIAGGLAAWLVALAATGNPYLARGLAEARARFRLPA